MSSKVNPSLDLPLSSNHHQFEIFHHLLDLKCDFNRKVFRSCLVVLIKQGTEWSDLTEFRIVLDCSDIKIDDVEEIIDADDTEEIDPSDYSWMNSIFSKRGSKLSFSSDDWTVTVFDKQSRFKTSFPLMLRLSYTTRMHTRSLHWRQDSDGNPCVYTPAAAVNNRGLFPSQDIPRALATWTAKISVPVDDDSCVFCTGDEEPSLTKEGDLKTFYFHTKLMLPMSTFALAVGSWEARQLTCEAVAVRFIGPKKVIDDNFALVNQYIPASLDAAKELIGPYPLSRCDIVVVHRSFSGLGLASPNLMFLSPSIFSGDTSLLMKISHEVSHGWFGIMIGSLDWTEAWISEGFATFMEEVIHDGAMVHMGVDVDKDLAVLRSLIRYESLVEEVGNTSQDLQLLRPLEGNDLRANDRSYVKNGINPMAGMTQAHYIKGYFLLHYLLELCGDRKQFFDLLKNYISTYFGQLVSSTHFIDMFFTKFCQITDISKAKLMRTWLHSPGIPQELEVLSILDVRRNDPYREVSEAYREIYEAIHQQRDKKRNVELGLERLRYSEQVSLLLNLLIKMESIPSSVLKQIKQLYHQQISSHPELGHKWAEIVIKNKFRSEYSQVSHFLRSHQSMGVFLYGELLLSKNKTLKMMFQELVEDLKDEMDDNSKSVIQDLI